MLVIHTSRPSSPTSTGPTVASGIPFKRHDDVGDPSDFVRQTIGEPAAFGVGEGTPFLGFHILRARCVCSSALSTTSRVTVATRAGAPLRPGTVRPAPWLQL